MDFENLQRKQQISKNEYLIKKMWRAENFKNSILKLSKISSKQSPPTASPIELSLISNSENNQKTGLVNCLTSRDNSFNIQNKCRKCQKFTAIINQQKIHNQELQHKYAETLKLNSQICQQKQDLIKKLSKLQKILEKTKQSIEPYKNNVILMEQHLQAIKDSLVNPYKQIKHEQNQKKIQKQFDQKKRTMDFEFDFLRKTHEREQENNETKMSRLNFVINYMQNKNKELEAQNVELIRSNKILNGIIHESGYVVQQRQLFHMASEQLYQIKNEYKKQKKEKEYLTRLVQRLKNKIYMLTSLIGYGVVSNIENNDLHELSLLRNNIDKLNKVQSKLTLDVYGIQSIKNYKSCYNQVKQFSNQDQPWSCLYQSNFLIMFQDQQIKNALQQNVTTIIKPDFFLLVRAIFDSKYSQFIIDADKSNRFQDFTYTFIDFFRLKKNEKRIEINSKRNGDEKDFMKTNFLLRIFDRKIGYLPQIVTFREFLIKNTPQDEIFYYLMCRNLIFNGPQLDNYINCSDPYNFVPYQRVLSRIQQLLQHYDKSTKTIVFNHLNQKKVMKNKKLLIKANYVIRLLLEVYRRFKKQKIVKLRIIFQQTCRFTKSDFMKFIHFKQILRKNFPYLTNSQICENYRKSMSIFNTQSQSTFFEAFCASCIQYIFLKQNLKFNEEVKRKINGDQAHDCNYLMQLIPDSVTQIGNECIYNEYISYIKLKNINGQTKVNISQFLLKIIQLRMHSMPKAEKQYKLFIEMIDSFNNKLIDFVNQNFKKRQKYEQQMEKASSKIGKQFKKKIYQFYSEFIKDIQQQIHTQNQKN